MTYDQARDQEQLGKLEAAIGSFINRFNERPNHPNRQTIILFPGGLGSCLVRADIPYHNGAQGHIFDYDTVWLDCSVLTGAALDLQLQNGLDTESKFILADGAIDFHLMDIRPYNRFIQWCGNRNLDWFVYGWEWRRRLDDTVSLFLAEFLPRFRQRVQAACNADPLQNCTLVGHSFGGMVVKLIMNDANPIVDQMKRAVTVGSPFYGYAGQAHVISRARKNLISRGRRASRASSPRCRVAMHCYSLTRIHTTGTASPLLAIRSIRCSPIQALMPAIIRSWPIPMIRRQRGKRFVIRRITGSAAASCL